MAEADQPAAAKKGTMGWHRVCLNTIVRKEKVLDSERLRILPMGSRVNVVEQQGRRVRIDQPIVGWCSLNSSNGDTILKPLDGNAKVAPTPRSGQAAVNNLQSRVAAAQAQIDQAQKAGQGNSEIESIKADKEQLEARLRDLERKNAEQAKMFEDWKTAAAVTTTEHGCVPTDIQNIQFRNGDACIIDSTTVPELEGICIVRCVDKDENGNERIGCDYKSADDDVKNLAKDAGWKPDDGMKPIWLTRKNLLRVLPTVKIIQAMEHLSQENTDLQFYKRTAEAMIKKVKEFTDVYKAAGNVTIGEESMKGEEYGEKFYAAFKLLDITEA